jgi:hypothetical protein
MSDWLLKCKGCGCAYLRTDRNGVDFCTFCCRELIADPAGFKTLEQREAEKAVLGKKPEKKRK